MEPCIKLYELGIADLRNSAYLGIENTMLRGQYLNLDNRNVHSGRYLIQEGQEYNR